MQCRKFYFLFIHYLTGGKCIILKRQENLRLAPCCKEGFGCGAAVGRRGSCVPSTGLPNPGRPPGPRWAPGGCCGRGSRGQGSPGSCAGLREWERGVGRSGTAQEEARGQLSRHSPLGAAHGLRSLLKECQ